MSEKIYDCNVWDWAGHETNYESDPIWRVDIYECDNYYTHDSLPFKVIWLSKTQADMLTLGKSVEEGGDYAGDSDFWIDPDGFLEVYKNIPRKVRRHLSEYVVSKEELVGN